MAWLIRKELSPIRELARRAEGISSSEWHFDAPEKATHTVELKPLVAALEGALERLRRSFEQQRRFTNDAAHELKTDVAIVKSSLQLLSMRRRTVEEYAEGLAVSLEDFTRLQTTVQKMLTLARLEQPVEHSSPNETTPSCSLRDSMQEAVHQSKALADLKSIQVIVKFAANVIVAIDNRDALLLCSNIVLNALQHSPEGSVVQISMTVHEGQVQIAVQDQGEGISEGDRSHVFEPFYRGDQSRSRKSGGSGLGLSICKAICERSGGSIEIANHTEGGALVTAMLPLAATIPAALSEWRK
jgi:signal transduction histidine kinase